MKKIIIAIIAILIISGNKSCFCSLDPFGGGGAEITPGAGSELTSDGDGTAHPLLDEGTIDSAGSSEGDSSGISPEGITDPAEGTSPVSPPEPVVEEVSVEQTGAGGLELDLDSDITDPQPAGGMEDVSPQPAVVQEVTAGNSRGLNINPGEQTVNGNAQSPSGTITDATLSAQDAGTEGPPTPADVSGGEPVSGSSGEDLPMMGGGRDGVDDGVYQSEDKNGAHADEGEQVTTGDEEGGKSPPADTPPPSSNSDETGPIGQLPGDKNRDDKQGYGANNTANDPSDVQNSGHQEDIVDKTVKGLKKGPHTQLSVALSESWLNSDREDFKRRAPGMIKDERISPSTKIGLYIAGVSNGVDVPPPSPLGGDGGGDGNGGDGDGDGNGDGNNDDGLSFPLYLGKDKRISQQEQNRWGIIRDLRVKAKGAQQVDGYKQVLGQHLGYAWTHTQLPKRDLKKIAQYYSAQDAEFKGWFAQNIWWASVMAAQQGNSTGMENFQQFLGQLSPSQQEEVYSIIKTVGPIDGEGRMGSSIDTSPEGEFHPSVSPGPSGGNFYSVGSVNNGVQREVGYSGMGLTYAGEGFNLSDSSGPLGMNFYSPGSVDDYGMQREEGSGRYYASVLSPLYGGYL
ncbi:MAG TPA: hypothetical protein ENF97_01265, partial [Candidatus Omnitrophica bacterium]|nr:hypothetical protein [Candidatus Omnitrophota bacterium]